MLRMCQWRRIEATGSERERFCFFFFYIKLLFGKGMMCEIKKRGKIAARHRVELEGVA